MKRINGFQSLPKSMEGAVLSIGNFDGPHVGHMELARRVVTAARSRGVPSVIMTFSPHPSEVISPGSKIVRISTLDFVQGQLQKIGVDYFVVEPFNQALAQTSASEFFENWIWKPFKPSQFIVGHDFCFGRNREGDEKFLKGVCSQHEIELEVVAALEKDSQIVSSTKIRELLKAGQLKDANSLLGHPYQVKGRVVRGDGRGKVLGFPTANLDVNKELLLPPGVYFSKLILEGYERPALTNIGYNPTFVEDRHRMKFETYMIDQRIDIYNQEVQVVLLERLRPEKKFPSPEALVKQIGEDVETARNYFMEST